MPIFCQEYKTSNIIKVTPVVVGSPNLRKSTRQKIAPVVYKTEVFFDSSNNSNKRKASSASNDSPTKPSKVFKAEPTIKVEPMDCFQTPEKNSNGSQQDVQVKKETSSESPKIRIVPEASLLKRPSTSESPIINKPEVRSLLKKPANPLMRASDSSLLRTSLLKPEIGKSTPELPSSITLSPALPSLAPVSGMFKKTSLAAMPTKPDPKMIEEVNNSWAQSLMSKSKRPKGSSPSFSETSMLSTASPVSSATLSKSVTLQRVVPSTSVLVSSV
jgi:hypothetical protein